MQSLSLSFSTIFAAFLLSACTSITSSEKVDAAARESTREQITSTPDAWSTSANEGAKTVDWVASFNDQTLQKLVEEAQANNKDLQAAAANVERSRALAAQAGASLKPALNLSSGGTRSGNADSSTASSNYNIGLQVDWELDLWGRIRSGSQAAAASAQAAEADYRYAQHSLAAATAKAYFTNIEANLQLDIARENLSILEETTRIVKVQYDNDVVSSQDLALARSDLATAREGLLTLEGSQRDAARALEILLGRYPSAELTVRESLPKTPSQPPVGIPSEILERRPDLIAAERRVASAFNALNQAKAARLPSISLTSSTGGSSNSLSNLLDPTNVAWQLGGNLLAPLFDGGTRRAQVEIATADQKQALAAYGQAALTAFKEVEINLDQGVVLARRISELQEAEKESKKAYRIANLRYKEGEIALLELLTIQQRVIAAKSNLTSVQRLLLEQRVNLSLALGGDWQL